MNDTKLHIPEDIDEQLDDQLYIDAFYIAIDWLKNSSDDSFDNEDNPVQTLIDYFKEFEDEQIKAFIVASGISHFSLKDIFEKIKNHEYTLREDVTNDKDIGYMQAEAMELPQWAYIYFDFEKFGSDVKIDLNGTLSDYGWFNFN